MWRNSTTLSPIRQTFIEQPVIPKLKALEKGEIGISPEAAKDINVDLKAQAVRYNEAPSKKWTAEKDLIEKAYKQGVVLDQAREYIAHIQQDINCLKGEAWNRRILDLSCQGQQLPQAYATVTTLDFAAFRTFSLDIQQLAGDNGGQLQPITLPDLQKSLNWPEGHFIVNTQKIPVLSSMSLTDVMFAVNQAGQGTFQMNYILIQMPTPQTPGQLQLSFESLKPDSPLVFDDDVSGKLLTAMGFSSGISVLRPAQILINETISVQRPTNVISDVMPGVTLELKQITPPEAKGFLKVSIKSAEDLIIDTLDHLIKTLRELHAHLEVHAPRDPKVEGLLKPFSFLRMFYSDVQALFSQAFGPSAPTGQKALPRDFGFFAQDELVTFNPDTLKRQLVSPEACRTFFSRMETVNRADIGILRLPPSFWGQIQIRLVQDGGATQFLFQAPTDRVEISGIVQGTMLKGPQGHPLEAMQLFFGASTTQALNRGETLTAQIQVTPGLMDAFAEKLERLQGPLDATVAQLKETVKRSLEKIHSINGELDKKRKELSSKSAKLQQTYMMTKLQNKLTSHLAKQLDQDSI